MAKKKNKKPTKVIETKQEDKEIVQPFSVDIEIPETKEGRASGSFTVASVGAIALSCSWSATKNTSANTSNVSASLSIYASAQGTCLSGSHLTIGTGNGARKNYSNYLNAPSSAVTHNLVSHSMTIAHDSNGNGSVNISGALVWNGYMWHPSGGQNFNTLSGNKTVTLDKIEVETTPGVPPTASISGVYAKNNSTTINFTGPTGKVTNYKIYYRHWIKHGDQYSPWYHHGNNTSGTYSIGHGNVNGDAFQMAVSAVNGSYESAKKETGWIYHQGASVNNGGFKNGTVRVWNGSSWVQGYVRVWNGSSWVIGQ